MSESVLPCFVCGALLDSVWVHAVSDQQQADDACYFRSMGQYGSAVFDPMDDSYLEINICDPCLAERKERVLICTDRVTRKRESRLWNLLNQDIE